MIKMICSFIVMVVLVVVLFQWMGKKSVDLLEDDLKEHVGEDIYIKGEAFQIVDYSLIRRTFTLDDGRVVSVELIKN